MMYCRLDQKMFYPLSAIWSLEYHVQQLKLLQGLGMIHMPQKVYDSYSSHHMIKGTMPFAGNDTHATDSL